TAPTQLFTLSLHYALPIFTAVRGPGDARDEDLRPLVGLAELDLPAAERRREQGRAARVWNRSAQRVRSKESVMAGVDYLERIPRSEEHTSELQSRGHIVCR